MQENNVGLVILQEAEGFKKILHFIHRWKVKFCSLLHGDIVSRIEMLAESFNEGPFVFRLNDSGVGPLLLTQVCLERGWKEYNPDTNEQWNLWWRTSGFPIGHYKSLHTWQYINHVPQGSLICRKDNLVRYLRCMKKVYGPIYDFSPNGYNLPSEYTKLAAEYASDRPMSGKDHSVYEDDKPVWICKPVSQSQGKGIFLFRKLSELSYNTNTIVQRYIEKPLLIGGYKFDLRLYVCIPSYHPMTIYLYKEGLVRFGTDKFTLNDLENPFRHLTNTAINKLSPGYAEMKENVGSGCKWTFSQLRRYFQQIDVADWLLWQKISVLVILTLLSQAKYIPSSVNCFEFLGFDVLVDNTLKPWLLEVNLSPALGNDCDVDRLVKKPMLHDMFDLLGLPLSNMALSLHNQCCDESEEKSRNHCIRPVLSIQSSVVLIHAADKWRRRHRKMSAKKPLKNKLEDTKNLRAPSAKEKLSDNKQVFLHKSDVFQEALTETHVINRSVDKKLNNSNNKWGNGRDWKNAPPHEGKWVRIWPMNLGANYDATHTSDKAIVLEMIKFHKIARDIYKKYPTASECQLNDYLQVEMNMSREIWIPPL